MWKVEKVVKKGDYLYAVVRDHPCRTKNNYVLHHRVVMENHLERLLNPEEIVHHLNGNKHDNRLENLEITDNSSHVRHHRRYQIRLAAKFLCPNCGSEFSKDAKQLHSKKRMYFCSRRCNGKFYNPLRETHEVERAISENLLYYFFEINKDNSEETATTGSVETIRTSPEMVKI